MTKIQTAIVKITNSLNTASEGRPPSGMGEPTRRHFPPYRNDRPPSGPRVATVFEDASKYPVKRHRGDSTAETSPIRRPGFPVERFPSWGLSNTRQVTYDRWHTRGSTVKGDPRGRDHLPPGASPPDICTRGLCPFRFLFTILHNSPRLSTSSSVRPTPCETARTLGVCPIVSRAPSITPDNVAPTESRLFIGPFLNRLDIWDSGARIIGQSGRTEETCNWF